MRVLLVLHLQRDKLGQTVHQHGNVAAKPLGDLAGVGLLAAVLYRIVQQRRANGVGVKLQSRHDLGNSDGMGDIGFSAGTHLSLVKLICVLIGILDLCKVILLGRCPQDIEKMIDADVWGICLIHVGRLLMCQNLWS